MKTPTPLGYVELADGSLPIFPMNDIFINFTFQHINNWEALRVAINIFIERFQKEKPDTLLGTINGEIDVKTQFKQLIGKNTKTARDQDVKLTDTKEGSYFIEFQNSAYTDPPIPDRSVVYFGLGISHAKGKPANQIWLLAEAVPSVLHGKLFTRYILKDEVTGNSHPDHSGIMFADLEKLSEENSQAGELAALFLGKSLDPQDEAVRTIAAAIKTSFQDFKEDKEVVEMFTFRERWERDAAARARVEGRIEGEARGEAKGMLNTADRVLDLLKNGVAPTEIEALLLSMKNEYVGKKEAALS
ncbi:MAG: DUF305 domain-containing protein [Defluviitaleaceae bacterium]|nr:DUF305 domain-containing protein [Defluviitaleaceae bacterium]